MRYLKLKWIALVLAIVIWCNLHSIKDDTLNFTLAFISVGLASFALIKIVSDIANNK